VAITVFSVGVAGNGKMLHPFVEKLKKRFPQVIVYNRNEEAVRAEPVSGVPSIPSVSDFDALFTKTGAKETANIRSFHRHRFFNYDLDDNPHGSPGAESLLSHMIEAVGMMLVLPEKPAVVAENKKEEITAGETDMQEQATSSV